MKEVAPGITKPGRKFTHLVALNDIGCVKLQAWCPSFNLTQGANC